MAKQRLLVFHRGLMRKRGRRPRNIEAGSVRPAWIDLAGVWINGINLIVPGTDVNRSVRANRRGGLNISRAEEDGGPFVGSVWIERIEFSVVRADVNRPVAGNCWRGNDPSPGNDRPARL